MTSLRVLRPARHVVALTTLFGLAAILATGCKSSARTEEEHASLCWARLANAEQRTASCVLMCEKYGKREYCYDAGHAFAAAGDCIKGDSYAQRGCEASDGGQAAKMLACPKYSSFVQTSYASKKTRNCREKTWGDAMEHTRALTHTIEDSTSAARED